MADHMAIEMFFRHSESKLLICAPCKFISEKGKSCYVDNGQYNWTVNPGRTANIYHQNFSKLIDESPDWSLNQIQTAIELGATLVPYSGFHERNLEVGKATSDTLENSKGDLLIAFTFDKSLSGGTKHAWDNATIQSKVHLHL